jgi:outer membrane protein TolC
LSDVEVALVRLSRERQRSNQLDQAAQAADHSLAIAQDQYRNGVLEYTELLDAQRTQDTAKDAAAQSHAALASDSVALFKALGGGWLEAAESNAEAPQANGVAGGGTGAVR